MVLKCKDLTELLLLEMQSVSDELEEYKRLKRKQGICASGAKALILVY